VTSASLLLEAVLAAEDDAEDDAKGDAEDDALVVVGSTSVVVTAVVVVSALVVASSLVVKSVPPVPTSVTIVSVVEEGLMEVMVV